MQYKGKNHHTYAINSLTFHKRKFWIDSFFIRYMITIYTIWNAIANSTIFFYLYNWINQKFIFIAIIHTSPFSHWTIGPHFKTKTLFLGMEISIINIRRSWENLIFIVGIPILVRRHLYTETSTGEDMKIFTWTTQFSRCLAVLLIFCILLLNWYHKL